MFLVIISLLCRKLQICRILVSFLYMMTITDIELYIQVSARRAFVVVITDNILQAIMQDVQHCVNHWEV